MPLHDKNAPHHSQGRITLILGYLGVQRITCDDEEGWKVREVHWEVLAAFVVILGSTLLDYFIAWLDLD